MNTENNHQKLDIETFEVYHYPLCPFSRKLRIILREKGLNFELITERYWQRRHDFLAMNPAGITPVLKCDKILLASNNAIFEYLEEEYPRPNLLSNTVEQRAEVRRVNDWFDIKFFNEVTNYLINERLLKLLDHELAAQGVNSVLIRAAKRNLEYHIQYLDFLLRSKEYLCGNGITIADYAAASQISVLDFFGDIAWQEGRVKEWYSLIKSRPSFKSLLSDVVPHISPPPHYKDPDF
jgi:glutathione S-transferase